MIWPMFSSDVFGELWVKKQTHNQTTICGRKEKEKKKEKRKEGSEDGGRETERRKRRKKKAGKIFSRINRNKVVGSISNETSRLNQCDEP